MNSPKTANYLLLAGFLLCMLQVWLPGYYLTGDGPCHLYNAQILHNLWSGKNIAFYERFFEVVGKPNPNWMTHILLGALLFVFKGVVAEKILLSGYVLLFVSGFTGILKRLDSDSLLWPLVVFVFVFNYVLAKGFYNFSFSMALLFWMINTWLLVLERINAVRVAGFFVMVCLTFFAHPVAFAFGGFCCLALSVSSYVTGYINRKERKEAKKAQSKTRLKVIFGNLLLLGLCLLPCGLMLIMFAAGEAHEGGISLHLSRNKILEFADFNCLVNVSSSEVILVRIVWFLLAGLLLFALFQRFRKGFLWQRYDGLFGGMLFALFLYLFFPDKLFGGSLFAIRAQYLWGLFMVCCIGYMVPAGKLKNGAGILFFIAFTGLSIPRIIVMASASDGVKDIVSAGQFIKPFSIVLPLDFSPGGLDKTGAVIADRNWMFCHAWQYMGVDKPLIILDNYEANTGYFPLVWKDSTNPYHHLCTNGAMEGQPPYATINYYKSETGVTIDYIMLWCYQDKWLWDEHFRKLYKEIMAGYRLVYKSESGRVELYERRSSPVSILAVLPEGQTNRD